MSRLSGPSHPTLRPTLAMSSLSSPQSTLPATASLQLARSLGSVSLESLQNMSPFDLFVAQLRTDHSETRVDAMRRCFVVANAMGADETLTVLLPFLAALILPESSGGVVAESGTSPNVNVNVNVNAYDEGVAAGRGSAEHQDDSDDAPAVAADFNAQEQDDELLLLLAEQLGLLVTSGLLPPFRALPLLPLLEKLASAEETVVRDKAVEAIQALLVAFSNAALFAAADAETRRNFFKQAHVLVLAMIKRLASADWFTPKVSAAAIIPAAYSFYQDSPSIINTSTGGNSTGTTTTQLLTQLQNNKRELRYIFKGLVEDETPMVRRATAKYLANLAQAIARLPPPTDPQLNKYLATASWNNGNSAATPIPAYTFAQSYLIYKGSKDQLRIKQHFYDLQTASLDKEAAGDTTTTLANTFSTLTISHRDATEHIKIIITEDIIPAFSILSRDEQDSIRAIAVVSSSSIACSLGLDADLTTKFILPVIKAASIDSSWRVRHRLASDYYIVAQAMGYHETGLAPRQLDLVNCLVTLLQDYEAEVRTSAVENIARIAQLIASHEIFRTNLSPLLPILATDSVMEVRSNLALSIMDCCDKSICNIFNDAFIKIELKGVIETLLNEDYAEVQLRILKKLSSITHLLSQNDKIVVAVLGMAKSTNWRVRESVTKLLPHLADSLGLQFFETQLLHDYWLPFLLDPVADVRAACVSGTPKLLYATGDDWVRSILVPKIIHIFQESATYLTRVTIVKCLESIASASSSTANSGRLKGSNHSLLDTVVDQLLVALNDKIPNVRTSAIKSLANLTQISDRSTVQNKIRPALFIRARDDPDFDCRYFAQSGMDRFV